MIIYFPFKIKQWTLVGTGVCLTVSLNHGSRFAHSKYSYDHVTAGPEFTTLSWEKKTKNGLPENVKWSFGAHGPSTAPTEPQVIQNKQWQSSAAINLRSMQPNRTPISRSLRSDRPLRRPKRFCTSNESITRRSRTDNPTTTVQTHFCQHITLQNALFTDKMATR